MPVPDVFTERYADARRIGSVDMRPLSESTSKRLLPVDDVFTIRIGDPRARCVVFFEHLHPDQHNRPNLLPDEYQKARKLGLRCYID